MTLVVDKFKTLIPPRAKSSPSGWTSFNAPCCHHRGHKPDQRKRGGLRFDHGIVYNCFNCKYTASWQPGRTITEKFKNLCRWMGATDDDIRQLTFEAIKTEKADYVPEASTVIEFTDKPLPEGARTLVSWALDTSELTESQVESLAAAIKYISDRGLDPQQDIFYWSPINGYDTRVNNILCLSRKDCGKYCSKI